MNNEQLSFVKCHTSQCNQTLARVERELNWCDIFCVMLKLLLFGVTIFFSIIHTWHIGLRSLSKYLSNVINSVECFQLIVEISLNDSMISTSLRVINFFSLFSLKYILLKVLFGSFIIIGFLFRAKHKSIVCLIYLFIWSELIKSSLKAYSQ